MFDINNSPLNNPSFPNSYKFENAQEMGQFARDISHNPGVKKIDSVGGGGYMLNVDFMDDSIRNKVNNQYAEKY